MLLLGHSISCRLCSARIDLTTAAELQSAGLGVTVHCSQCGSIWTHYTANDHESKQPVEALVESDWQTSSQPST